MPTAVTERRTRSRRIGRASIVTRRVTAFARTTSTRAAVLAALCLPLIFLHARWQPGLAVHLGTTSVHAYLSDFAVLAIVALAVLRGAREGFASLRPGRWLWLAIGAFLVWIVVELALGHVHTAAYPWRTHAVTAAKWTEYALLA